MDRKLIILLVIIIAFAKADDFAFDLGSTQYIKASDYWTVNIPLLGGSGNYKYICQLPPGWIISSLNQFKIPTSCSTNYNFEYVPRCKIIDLQLGRSIERSLSFKCTTNGYIITDNDYYHGLTSYSSGSIGTIAGNDALKRLANLASSFNGTVVFGSSNATLSNSNGSICLSGLPALSDCDQLIKDGNIVEIVALIQTVVNSTVKCDAKIAYLSDLLGRINSGLSIKTESISQLQGLIDSITAQVQNLLSQIQSLTSQQTALNLAGLKSQLDALTNNVASALNDYNTCVNSTQPYTDELQSLQL